MPLQFKWCLYFQRGMATCVQETVRWRHWFNRVAMSKTLHLFPPPQTSTPIDFKKLLLCKWKILFLLFYLRYFFLLHKYFILSQIKGLLLTQMIQFHYLMLKIILMKDKWEWFNLWKTFKSLCLIKNIKLRFFIISFYKLNLLL